jgi:hypothetical protein
VDAARAGMRGPASLCICIASSVALPLAAAQRAVSDQLGPGVLVLGGGSGGEVGAGPLRCNEFCGEEVLEGGIAVLLLGGALRVAHAVALGWRPVGDPHTVTEMAGDNVLVALDGRPATDVLSECLGVAGGAGASFVHHPLAVEVADGTVLRGAIAAGPAPGSVLLAGDLAEGARVRFSEFDRDALVASVEDAAGRALAAWAGAPPAGALVFECLSRWNVLGTAVHRAAERLRAALPPELPLAGMFVGGELAPIAAGQPCRVHNCSIVVVLLGGA